LKVSPVAERPPTAVGIPFDPALSLKVPPPPTQQLHKAAAATVLELPSPTHVFTIFT
jgi:hypothetical protein